MHKLPQHAVLKTKHASPPIRTTWRGGCKSRVAVAHGHTGKGRTVATIMRNTAAVFIAIILGLIIADLVRPEDYSDLSRRIALAVLAGTCWAVYLRQVAIAYRYEGAPVVFPIAFRWVVSALFGSLAASFSWILVQVVWPDTSDPAISTVVYGLAAANTIWFFSRWVTVGAPQIAGPGETGANT